MLSLSLFLVAASHAQAQTSETLSYCLIKIEGRIFDAHPCDMDYDTPVVVNFGHLDEGNYAGYWVYLVNNKNGTFEGYWNEEYGAPRAHTKLGTLKLEERSVGECFSGDNVLLCWHIPADTPIYYVEHRDPDEGGRVLLAYLNGLEYQLRHPAWEYDAPFEVHENADFDGDGRLDTLISLTNGGNCCPESISVVSYRGDGFFTFLDETPIVGGFGGTELVFDQGRPIIRVHDAASGAKSTNRQRGERDYAFINGHIELIAQRAEHSTVTEVASLGREEVAMADAGRKTLLFDIDADDIQDAIICTYWERWGVLNCQAEISGAKHRLDFQCIHVAVLPVVFGPRRSHRLMCDNEVIDY